MKPQTPLPDPGADALRRVFEELRDASLAGDEAKVCGILRGLLPDAERIRAAVARPDFTRYKPGPGEAEEGRDFDPNAAFDDAVFHCPARGFALAALDTKAMLRAMDITLAGTPADARPGEVRVQRLSSAELAQPQDQTFAARAFAREMHLRNMVCPLRADIAFYLVWFLQPRSGRKVPFPIHVLYWDGRGWSALYQAWCNPWAPGWNRPVARVLHLLFPLMSCIGVPAALIDYVYRDPEVPAPQSVA
ncbi:hypothetical protein DB346_01400 [Verrucomicrobia bacterium LW23]|nr:hypothetical protein DB346_01400 [Verrucomicrobia bacterium LW23]